MTPFQVGAIMLIACTFIFVPVLIYHTVQFKSNSTFIKFKHKRKKLVYSILAYSVFGLTIERPFMLLCNGWTINENTTFNIPLGIVSVFDSIFIAFFFILIIVHSWIFQFDKQHNIDRAKSIFEVEYQSWFILNKHKYGRVRFILALFVLPLTMFMIAQVWMQHALNHIHSGCYTSSLMSSIFALPIFGFYYQSRGYSGPAEDVLCPKKEIQYQFYTSIIWIIHACGLIVEFSLIHHTVTTLLAITHIIIEVSTTFTLVTSAFITIYKAKQDADQLTQTALPQHILLDITTGRSSLTPSNPKIKCDFKTMLRVMADDDGFKAFMQHLV